MELGGWILSSSSVSLTAYTYFLKSTGSTIVNRWYPIDESAASNDARTSFSVHIENNLVTVPDEKPELFTAFVFPNPSNGQFTIQWAAKSENKYSYSIFDLLGNKVHSIENLNCTSNSQNEMTINVLDLVSGSYMLKLTSGNRTKFMKIVIVK